MYFKKFVGNSKCGYCKNFDLNSEKCSNCGFEYDGNYNPFEKDDWDILDLKYEDGYEHHQILWRLWSHDVDCVFVDIWIGEMAFILGVNSSVEMIADALNMHKKAIYYDYEHDLCILNLIEERMLR